MEEFKNRVHVKHSLTPQQKAARKARLENTAKLLMWLKPETQSLMISKLIEDSLQKRIAALKQEGKAEHPQAAQVLAQLMLDLKGQTPIAKHVEAKFSQTVSNVKQALHVLVSKSYYCRNSGLNTTLCNHRGDGSVRKMIRDGSITTAEGQPTLTLRQVKLFKNAYRVKNANVSTPEVEALIVKWLEDIKFGRPLPIPSIFKPYRAAGYCEGIGASSILCKKREESFFKYRQRAWATLQPKATVQEEKNQQKIEVAQPTPKITSLANLSSDLANNPTVNIYDPTGQSSIDAVTAKNTFAEGGEEKANYDQIFADARDKANLITDTKSREQVLAAINDSEKSVNTQVTRATIEIAKADPADVSQAKAAIKGADTEKLVESVKSIEVEKLEERNEAEKEAEKQAIVVPPLSELDKIANKGDSAGIPKWVYYAGGALLVGAAIYVGYSHFYSKKS